MGKNKEQNAEVANAFVRMNYLYQAAVLTSKVVPDAVLANYYGRLMKEVSKKVVEKIHPEIKRSLCPCCCFPIFTGSCSINAKIKPHKRRRKRKMKAQGESTHVLMKSNIVKRRRNQSENSSINRPSDVQKLKRNSRPNRLVRNCNKCGFSRKLLQRPNYSLWVDKYDDDVDDDDDGT